MKTLVTSQSLWGTMKGNCIYKDPRTLPDAYSVLNEYDNNGFILFCFARYPAYYRGPIIGVSSEMPYVQNLFCLYLDVLSRE